MLTLEKKNLILQLVEKHSVVTVSNLAEVLGVSEVTVRKLLNNLSRQGLLRRTHGGAVSLSVPVRENDLQSKERTNVRKKRDIARKAYELIADYDTVFLDAGTTTLELARLIRNGSKRNISVITNGMNVAAELLEAWDIELMLVGGRVRHDVVSCVGPAAEAMVSSLVFDKSFVAANNLSLEHGVTTPHQTEAAFKRAAFEAGRQRILLCDSSKFGSSSMSKIRPLRDFDSIITDSGLDAGLRESFRAAGAALIIAESRGGDPENGGS